MLGVIQGSSAQKGCALLFSARNGVAKIVTEYFKGLPKYTVN